VDVLGRLTFIEQISCFRADKTFFIEEIVMFYCNNVPNIYMKMTYAETEINLFMSCSPRYTVRFDTYHQKQILFTYLE
jgi:hypothetical protein